MICVILNFICKEVKVPEEADLKVVRICVRGPQRGRRFYVIGLKVTPSQMKARAPAVKHKALYHTINDSGK